ncbi:bacteriophage spanin2 family protein [uncultured Roseobacter sp.]|uniref:bacteriophage spanin2 family protein n=1 Tax=uncultured Roseobacter sp. TaxID=114847 RepID=UPI00260D0820|nr:bacteriophage spanin2 family protein [uncultured Roseobacter sp.]
MSKPVLVFLMILLPSCGGPLSLLTGGGPNVAANVQAGKENTQNLGVVISREQTLMRPRARFIEQSSGATGLRSENIGTVVQSGTPPWLILAFAVALFLDSPVRWPGQVWRLFRKPRTAT